jgi:flagellar hook-associated protein 3 FlgL
MRIATNSASNAMLARIQALSTQQARLQTEVSTGQRIFTPEDDPAGVGRVLNWNNERKVLAQYQKNASRALDTSQATFAALQEFKKLSDRAGELGTLGASTAGPDAFRAYSKEVNQLIEQAVQQGNTQFRNDYIFGGTKVDSAPFTVTRNGAGQITGVAYAGNANQAVVQLSETSSVAPGTDNATNTGLGAFINNLVALRDGLAANDSTAVAAAQSTLNASENMFVDALAEHGAIQMRIEVNQRQQDARIQNIEKLISSESDVDLASTVVRLSQASTAYQAALASGTKILQMSILDYIR